MLRAVEALDVGVRDLEHRHALLVTQRIQLVDVFAPDVDGFGITLAETRVSIEAQPLRLQASAQISGSSQSTLSITTVR